MSPGARRKRHTRGDTWWLRVALSPTAHIAGSVSACPTVVDILSRIGPPRAGLDAKSTIIHLRVYLDTLSATGFSGFAGLIATVAAGLSVLRLDFQSTQGGNLMKGASLWVPGTPEFAILAPCCDDGEVRTPRAWRRERVP